MGVGVHCLAIQTEEPSIVLYPCLHLLFVSERNSIVAYTILTNNVLFCAVYLFSILRPSRLASLLQGLVSFEPCTHLFCSFVQLFIPPPGFRSPLVVLGDTTDFVGSIQQRVLQLWLNFLNWRGSSQGQQQQVTPQPLNGQLPSRQNTYSSRSVPLSRLLYFQSQHIAIDADEVTSPLQPGGQGEHHRLHHLPGLDSPWQWRSHNSGNLALILRVHGCWRDLWPWRLLFQPHSEVAHVWHCRRCAYCCYRVCRQATFSFVSPRDKLFDFFLCERCFSPMETDEPVPHDNGPKRATNNEPNRSMRRALPHL